MRGRSLISRRDALLGGLCLCCAANPGRSADEHSDTIQSTEIAPGIHVRRGADEIASDRNQNAIANVGFIVGREGVAVLDGGGSVSDGERLRRRIREVTSLPIRYVLMSHVHPDHIFGASAFLQDEPAFVGHARLPQALARRGEYYRERLEEVLGRGNAGPIVQPTMLVRDRTQIDLGGRLLELQAHALAHTDSDLTVVDAQTRTLFASDLLFVGRVPSLDGSLKGWLQELSMLASLDAARTVPGHGPVSVDFASASGKLRQYLETLLRETRQAIAKGVDIDAAPATVAQSERGNWTLFDEYHGHNVTQAYKELEWE
ncbi:MAG TPA: quinoprotein relay system zinc metallohydrolase 2 [Povalibacter sp.]|nr:quinoprotein relay system zinc metallohydrolase 2 [Povalibacter sp.]